MDFESHFQAFLESTVNLKQWKLDQLDGRVAAVVNAFQADQTVGSMYKEHVPQGSWAHQTIINPVGKFDEFDADILLHLEQEPEWNENPKKYLQQVRAAFKRTTTYKEMVVRKNRCVRIEYANDCHIDVVPSITLDNGRQVIIYYKDNVFEETNPVGFAEWMKERDDLTNGNLRRVIRLLKWVRDYKNTFSCPSVILTVLLGHRVRFWDTEAYYANVPTTLVNLLEDLRDWLSLYFVMPLLDDPSCPGVSFNHRWDESKYLTFKQKIEDYAIWAREAYDLQEQDSEAAVTVWQKLFGDEFAAEIVKDARAAILEKKAITASSALQPGRTDLDVAPHEEFIQDKVSNIHPRHNATIVATILRTYRKNLRKVRAVEKGQQLEFHVSTDAPEPYEVLWKVRNRGQEAAHVSELRGEIRYGGSQSRNVHRESTRYSGVHYIEAYVVKDGVVVASDHHDVRIL